MWTQILISLGSHVDTFLMSMAIHRPTGNLSFISGLSIWSLMPCIGATVVNSLELTNFSSSKISIGRLLK